MRNYILFIGIIFKIFQKVHLENVIKVLVDDTALLPCHLSAGNSPHAIEWLKRGNAIPIYIKIGKYPAHVNPYFKGRISFLRNSSTLRISNIQIRDEGWYDCRVMYLDELFSEESKKNSKSGKIIKLLVVDPPAFKSTPPPSIVAREGESLMLRCRVVGKPQPDVTWRKDGWIINDDWNGEVVNGNELRVSSLTRLNRGNYLCQARNSEGQVEHTTSVYVQASPEMTVKPFNTTVKEGQDAFFGCKASGFPVNIVYSWLYNGIPISQSSTLVGRHRALSDGTLVIYDVTRIDVGEVTCQADNGYGDPPSSSAYLIIEYPATVIHVPELLYAGEGLDFEIQCNAVGVPPISTFTWRKDGIIINKQQSARIQVMPSGILSFSQIRYSDEGQYTCTPYNVLGTDGESPLIRVVVQEPPTFRVRPKDEVEGEIGSKLELNCVAEGEPEPNIFWRKNGEDLVITSDGRYNLNAGNLTITTLTKQDFGKWACVVLNPVAEVTSDVRIYIKYTTPHAISNFTVMTSSTSATLSWLPGYDGGYPQHYMIWYKRADKGDHTWLTDYVGGHRMEAVVNNLEPDSVYQISLLPENALGSGPFSKTLSAKTESAPTKSPLRSRDHISLPRSVTYSIYDDVIELSWKPPLLADAKSLLGYLIEYRLKVDLIPAPTTNTNATPNLLESRNAMNKIHKRDVSERENQIGANSNIALPLKNPYLWIILAALPSNETSYKIGPGMLFQDTTYEFQISTVTSSAYSAPTEIIVISTNGFPAYNIASPGVLTTSENDVTAAMLAAGVAGGVFLILSITAMIGYCYEKCKINKMTRDHSDHVIRSFLVNRKLKKTISFNTSPHHDEVNDVKVTLSKLEKHEATMPSVNHAWSKFRLAKSIKSSVLIDSDLRRTKSLNQGKTSEQIAPIIRSSDGKFRMDITNNQITSSERYINNVNFRHNLSGGVRPFSESFSPNNTEQAIVGHCDVIVDEKEWLNSTCEIDCSQSNIEVRYIPSEQSHSSTPSLMDDVTSPCLYQSTNKRESRDFSFFIRRPKEHGCTSMSATAEYVHLKDLGIVVPETPDEDRETFRQLGGATSFHNPSPVDPLQEKYHTHVHIPKARYHSSPRECFNDYPEHQTFTHCGKQQYWNEQYQINSKQFLQDFSKHNTLSPKRSSNSLSSGHTIFKNLGRFMSLDRQKNPKVEPSVLPIKHVALKESLTSHSCSMTSLSSAKLMKAFKSFSRRSMSEETLGVSKSSNECNSSSQSQHIPRKIHSKSEKMCSLKNVKEMRHELHLNSADIVNDKLQDETRQEVAGYDPDLLQSNCTTSLTNNNDLNIVGHNTFSSNQVVSCSPNLPLATPRVRDSSASSTDSRSKKDASSVDEKYEWDSEFAMESEILEALKNFESCKCIEAGISKNILHQLRKLSVESDSLTQHSHTQTEHNTLSPTSTSEVNYSKECIEKRCAALKQEYLDYQQRNLVLVKDGFI